MKKITAKFDAYVLVVDDYPLNAEVIKEMLEMMGCNVDIAEDGNEAVEMHKKHNYDIIFMDIQMPVSDGIAATQQIRSSENKGSRTPVIALTANAMPGDKERYIEVGMDDFISKPLRTEDIERVLSKFVRK
jgi:CheY-like chemotaxis protein